MMGDGPVDPTSIGPPRVLSTTRGRERRADRQVPDLPKLDRTGKVHGELPAQRDLRRYDVEELAILRDELKQSVQKRIEITSQKGSDFAHAERQAAEQALIQAIDKHLE
jgi:hypothetical protein